MAIKISIWMGRASKNSSVYLQAGHLRDALSRAGVDVILVTSEMSHWYQIRRLWKQEWVVWAFFTFDPRLFMCTFKRRVIIYYHNITPSKYFWRSDPLLAIRALLGRAQLWLLPRGWKYVAVSEFNAAELRLSGKRRVETVPCFVRTSVGETARKRDIPTVMFAGRIVENKNCINLVSYVEAAAEQLGQQVVLVIVGDGHRGRAYYEAFCNRISKIPAEGYLRVEWIQGGVDEQCIDRLYSDSWLYVSASLHEGFGLPVCEAISRGTPALYISCGGTELALKGIGLVQDEANLWREIATHLSSSEVRTALLRAQAAIVATYEVPGPAEAASAMAILQLLSE